MKIDKIIKMHWNKLVVHPSLFETFVDIFWQQLRLKEIKNVSNWFMPELVNKIMMDDFEIKIDRNIK